MSQADSVGTSLSVELYRKLRLVRLAEEYIIRHYPEDDMKTPMHMSMGQEAISVGVCHALGLENQIWTSYRSHAAFLAKTDNVEQFFAEIYGRATGIARGKGGSMHMADPTMGHMAASAIVGSVLPVAVGMAFANKTKGTGQVSCVLFGDGALDEGVFWESLNLACIMRLPVLFVCEDNGLAVHTPASARQGYRSIVEVAQAFNCTVITEDTTDVERIYDLTQGAIETIRTTGLPVFLHLKCYRYLEHVGVFPDFDAEYRSLDEYESWHDRDGLALQRSRLIEQGLSPQDLARMETLIEQRVQASVAAAQEAPFPELEELYRGVFYEGA